MNFPLKKHIILVTKVSTNLVRVVHFIRAVYFGGGTYFVSKILIMSLILEKLPFQLDFAKNLPYISLKLNKDGISTKFFTFSGGTSVT